jgi:hypothetical protein
MRRWGLVLFYIGVVLAGTGAAFVTRAALDTNPPRQQIFGYTHRTSYVIGDQVTGQWRLMAMRACDGQSIRWLTSSSDRSYIINLPTENVVLPDNIGPLPTFVMIGIAPFQLPPMPVGLAYYHRRTIYACNWLQKSFPGWFGIEVEYPVLEFYVSDSGLNPPGAGHAPAPPPQQ